MCRHSETVLAGRHDGEHRFRAEDSSQRSNDAYLRTEFVEEADAQDLSRRHHQVDVSLLDGDLGRVHVVQHLFKDVRADEVDLDHRRVVHLHARALSTGARARASE